MNDLPGQTLNRPNCFWISTLKSRLIFGAFLLTSVILGWTPVQKQSTPVEAAPAACPPAKYLIVLIGDGMGNNQRLAANMYTGDTPAYQTWSQYWASTYPAGGSYDPDQTWGSFSYVLGNPTDSAAAATALFTGNKTGNIRIGVSEDGSSRLVSIADKARSLGKAVGAVTTVYISHATPGAWLAHNDNRNNGYAIADESLWGDPNTTGAPITSTYYSGAHGPTLPPADVVIGAGHPLWDGGTYVNTAMRNKLAAESGSPGAFTLVERLAGSPDGGARLLATADNPSLLRLAGLFGGVGGNIEYRKANGSDANLENPTLAQMARAALLVLARDHAGFVLMIEGGAIDKAAHANNMDQMVGEVLGFNEAVQTVIDWVDDPATASTWANTLVIVTADHETGYLTQAPNIFPNQPLGEITTTTLALEKTNLATGLRASWLDTIPNGQIDREETVYWAWNTGGHTNSLVPLFAKGAGSEMFATKIDPADLDPVRGVYLDNTDVFSVMDSASVSDPCSPRYPVFLPVMLKKK
jgi:alkaline phosphatase